MAPKYACRKDTVHNPISDALQKLGVGVVDLSMVGDGCPDEVWTFQNNTYWIEYKTGKGKLRSNQVEWQRKHPFIKVNVIRTIEEAISLLGLRQNIWF